MERSGHETPLPSEMQGRWVEANDPSYEMIISDGEIVLCGQPVDYKHKILSIEESGALMVELEFPNEVELHVQEITMMFYWPDGRMHTMNEHGVAELVRAGS